MACSKLALPRKLGRSPGVRFARKRGLAGMAFLLTAALAHPAGAQVHRCDGGQIVKDNPSFDYCSAFRQYLKPDEGVIDRKLEAILKNDGSLKGRLRSYAFVVSVSKYPNLQNPDDQVIKGVGAELDTIVDFLKAQGFDEIVVLPEEEASHENIDYFLSDYFLTAFRKQKDQDRLARFLFAFDGHGMPGNDPDTHGALALSEATGDDDIDLKHSFFLDDLSARLKNLAVLSYETLALVGSCFSGGLFQPSVHRGDTFFYPNGPGAHAITATKANQLAWTSLGGKGTVFFTLLKAEVNMKHPDALASMLEGGVISGADGQSDSFSDGVVALSTIIERINSTLSKIPNPKSADGKYPLLNIGELLEANDTRYGAFFFLEPSSAEQPPAAVMVPAAPPAASAAVAAEPSQASPPLASLPALGERTLSAGIAPSEASSAPNAPSTNDQMADEAEITGAVQHHSKHAARHSQISASSENAEVQTAERSAAPSTTSAHARIGADEEEPQATAEGEAVPSQSAAAAPNPPSSPAQHYGDLPPTTGSAVLFHPELKIFKRPESYPIRGVDLSWWNGAIPFEKLAGTHEIRFAYLKATEGANKKDPAFDDLLREAHSVGILTGAYHFFNFCDSPQSQFENLSKTAAGELDLPFAIAVEWLDGPSDPKQRDCSRDPEVVKSNLRQLLEDVAARYKKVPIIYAPSSAVGTLIDASFSNYPIWLADYHKILGLRKPTMRGRNPWTIWQFTDHATLPGLDKPVELDVFFGNEEQFSSFVKGEGNIGLSAAEKSQ